MTSTEQREWAAETLKALQAETEWGTPGFEIAAEHVLERRFVEYVGVVGDELDDLLQAKYEEGIAECRGQLCYDFGRGLFDGTIDAAIDLGEELTDAQVQNIRASASR